MSRICFLLLGCLSLASFAGPVTYKYDAAGRLITADYGSAGAIAYTYDKSGNLVNRTVTPAASGSGGVITSVNIAGAPASAGIVQNGWIEIRGNNLVPATTSALGVIWSDAPDFAQGRLPTQLQGISVTVNGKSAFVYFFCSAATDPACAVDQINALTPLDNTLGNVSIQTTSGGVSSVPFSVTLKSAVPSFLLFNKQGYVVATHLDLTLLGPTNLYPNASTPAAPGEVIVAYAVGLGLPTQPLTPGSSSQSGTLPSTPQCTIGGTPATVAAALISAGLYQFNITVPQNASSGDNPISCTYGAATTPSGDLITVR